jgi:hypothetical protein
MLPEDGTPLGPVRTSAALPRARHCVASPALLLPFAEAEPLRARYCQLVPLILINPSGTAWYPLRFLG